MSVYVCVPAYMHRHACSQMHTKQNRKLQKKVFRFIVEAWAFRRHESHRNIKYCSISSAGVPQPEFGRRHSCSCSHKLSSSCLPACTKYISGGGFLFTLNRLFIYLFFCCLPTAFCHLPEADILSRSVPIRGKRKRRKPLTARWRKTRKRG